MSAMREYLLSEIQRREHDLDALGREVRSIEVRKAVLDAELVLLRDMLSRADGTPEIGMAAVTDQPPRRSPARAGKSRLSQRWACVVMNAIKRYPAEIGTADVPDIQKSAGQPEKVLEIKFDRTSGLASKAGFTSAPVTERFGQRRSPQKFSEFRWAHNPPRRSQVPRKGNRGLDNPGSISTTRKVWKPLKRLERKVGHEDIS